jgi:hypothetical protein
MNKNNMKKTSMAALLAIALLVTLAACDDGSNDSGGGTPDTATLSGTTWVYTSEEGNAKYDFSGSNWTLSGGTDDSWEGVYKGTYSVSGTTITFKETHSMTIDGWKESSDPDTWTATLAADGKSFTTNDGGETFFKQ